MKEGKKERKVGPPARLKKKVSLWFAEARASVFFTWLLMSGGGGGGKEANGDRKKKEISFLHPFACFHPQHEGSQGRQTWAATSLGQRHTQSLLVLSR